MKSTTVSLRTLPSSEARRNKLEEVRGITLSHTGKFTFDEATASTRNCENMIGVAQVPVGVAGPVRLTHPDGDTADYYLPLATTEGALVASVSRGCKAISESGGANVRSSLVGATRGPVFKVRSLAESARLEAYVTDQFLRLKEIAEATSRHLTLKSVTSTGVGLYRYMRFVYDTKDAMGLNMVTIATDRVVRHIEEATETACVALSGNFCVDKKPSWQNMVNKRGRPVWAETVLSKAVLSDVLKTDAVHVFDTWMAKCMIGSAVSGSMGFNAQYANVIAALFIATGQDPAHVVEGSLGITTANIVNGDALHIGVYLPDLMIGTVGGGTGLATQREALSLLGVGGGDDGKHAERFAEIIGGAVLAGEVSLLSSLAEQTLSRSHEKLARGKTI
ncbi:MAG: hydroxymethylglutaryl-CoA reductase [Patescibacteria group bacterium]